MAILALLPDVVLLKLGMSEKQISDVKSGWCNLSSDEQKERLLSEQIDLARFVGCCRIRSQTVVEIDGRRVGWNGCNFRFCPLCSGLLATRFAYRIDRIVNAIFDLHKKPMTTHPNGPTLNVYEPKPRKKLPRKLGQLLKRRGVGTNIGSLALLTITISKQAGPHRLSLLDAGICEVKKRFQDPAQRPLHRELDVIFMISTAEDTFGCDGAHHHFHFLVFFSRTIAMNSSEELELSEKFDVIFREALKTRFGEAWDDAFLLKPYKGQTRDYFFDTNGEPQPFKWLVKKSGGWEPLTDREYNRLARSSKNSRPELTVATRDTDAAFMSIKEEGMPVFNVFPRSPIRGGVTVAVSAVAQYLSKGGGWNPSRELAFGSKKLGRGKSSLSPAQMIRLLHLIDSKDLGFFEAISVCGKTIFSNNLALWHDGDNDVSDSLIPLPHTIKFECEPDIASLAPYIDGYIQVLLQRQSKHTFKVPKVGRRSIDRYFPDRAAKKTKGKGTKACMLSHSARFARDEYCQILKGRKSLTPVTDKLYARFLKLYEKDFKERIRIFGNISALTRGIKKAAACGDELKAHSLTLKRKRAKDKKARVKSEFSLLFRFLFEFRADFFGTWDARKLQSMECPSLRNCRAAVRRLSLLAEADPKLVIVAQKLFAICEKLSKGDILTRAQVV